MTQHVTAIFIVLASMAWAPIFPETPALVPAAGAIEEFHAFVLPETTVALPSSIVDLRLEVDASAQQFNGYQVEIRCNPTVLRPDTVFEGSLMLGACPGSRFRQLSKTDSSMTFTHILLCHDVSVNGPGVLSIFRFRDPREGTSPARIASDPGTTFFDAGEYVAPTHPTRPRQVIFHDAVVRIVDPTSGARDLDLDRDALAGLRVRLYPNPLIGNSAIRLELGGRTPERVDVLDLQGRIVRNLAGPWTGPGPFVLQVGGAGSPELLVPSGRYFCRVRSAGRQGTSGFVLIR